MTPNRLNDPKYPPGCETLPRWSKDVTVIILYDHRMQGYYIRASVRRADGEVWNTAALVERHEPIGTALTNVLDVLAKSVGRAAVFA